MIVEHSILGNKQNSFHDFVFTQEGLDIHISSGSYWRMDETRFETDQNIVLDISTPTEDTTFEVWFTSDGIILLSGASNAPIKHEFNGSEPIDRLCWFMVPAGSSTLDDIPIHVIKIIEN